VITALIQMFAFIISGALFFLMGHKLCVLQEFHLIGAAFLVTSIPCFVTALAFALEAYASVKGEKPTK
jgi:hypothetical protein